MTSTATLSTQHHPTEPTNRRFPRRLARLAAVAIALVTAALAVAGPASAASVPNPSLLATCQNGKISVEGPDLRLAASGYPDWEAWYRDRLYVWTSKGWQFSMYSNWGYSDGSAWVAPDDEWFSIARGTYVKVIEDAWYYYHGTYVGTRSVYPIHSSVLLPQYVASDSSYCRV